MNLSGTAVLSPIAASGGARLEVQVTVHVRIPLIGGKLEKLICGHLAAVLADEERFTTTWIANRA